jgi:hypothetical protein
MVLENLGKFLKLAFQDLEKSGNLENWVKSP